MTSLTTLIGAQVVKPSRWYLGSMNDGLFIIDQPPRPSTDDAWHDRPDGPTIALPISGLTTKQAQAICDAHNALNLTAIAEIVEERDRLKSDLQELRWLLESVRACYFIGRPDCKNDFVLSTLQKVRAALQNEKGEAL